MNMTPTELGKRRVMSVRGSSLITLPKYWAKCQGIEKGDLVSIVLQEDGSLNISAA